MPNNENYISVEMFNAGIQELKNEIQKTNTEIRVINTHIDNIEKRLDDIHSFFSLFLVVITIMIAVIGFIPTVANLFKSLRKPVLTVEKVQEMIDSTVAKTLGSIGK